MLHTFSFDKQKHQDILRLLATMPAPSSADRHVTSVPSPGATPLYWHAKGPAVDDTTIVADRSAKRESSAYEHMQGFRHRLPAWEHQEALLQAVAKHQVVVVSGETGRCAEEGVLWRALLDGVLWLD